MTGIGIIGAGVFGEKHAEAILETKGIELIAASRRNSEELKKFSGKYNILGYTDYRELLKNKDIQAVVIAVPHQDHTRVAQDAAAAGKHILLEKPMATSVEDCDRIIQSANDTGICLMMAHVQRFMRSSVITKEILDSGEMGEIIYGTGTVAKKWMNPFRRVWHSDDPVGGGMLITVGIHYIDFLTWLFNSRVSSVRASISTRYHEHKADDAGMLFLQYENGITGSVISTGYENGAEIFSSTMTCTKGLLRTDILGGVHIGRENEWKFVPGSDSSNSDHEGLVNEWTSFSKAMETNSVPTVTGEDGRHIMEIIFAARESSRKKKEIWIR